MEDVKGKMEDVVYIVNYSFCDDSFILANIFFNSFAS
jgi:hypothetical protein